MVPNQFETPPVYVPSMLVGQAEEILSTALAELPEDFAGECRGGRFVQTNLVVKRQICWKEVKHVEELVAFLVVFF